MTVPVVNKGALPLSGVPPTLRRKGFTWTLLRFPATVGLEDQAKERAREALQGEHGDAFIARFSSSVGEQYAVYVKL